MTKGLSYHTEEKLNAFSHALGAILGVMGCYFLLQHNSNKSVYAQSSIVIYSISFVLLFLASTLYHSVSDPDLKRKFRIIDHISIYLLIAGTYTPVALITLQNSNGWLMFYVVWGIAALGIVLKIFFTGKFEVLSLLLYLAMGWLIVIDFQNLMVHTTERGVRLLFLGGAFYTLGTVFYAWRSIPYNHFIWHLFVLGGAFSHWFYIYFDVI